MATPPRSMSECYPRHYDIPCLILLSFGLLIAGLSLPLITVQQRLLWKHWENHYSAFTGAASLAHQGDYLLAGVLFFFSIVFPIAKLIALAGVWWVRLPEENRRRVLNWLEALGKWSMLDVFAVAVLIVVVKLGPLAHAEPRSGIYFFAAAVMLSMLTTMYVDYLVRRSSFHA